MLRDHLGAQYVSRRRRRRRARPGAASVPGASAPPSSRPRAGEPAGIRPRRRSGRGGRAAWPGIPACCSRRGDRRGGGTAGVAEPSHERDDGTRRAVEHQQARVLAVGGRLLRNLLRREIEVEEPDIHGDSVRRKETREEGRGTRGEGRGKEGRGRETGDERGRQPTCSSPRRRADLLSGLAGAALSVTAASLPRGSTKGSDRGTAPGTTTTGGGRLPGRPPACACHRFRVRSGPRRALRDDETRRRRTTKSNSRRAAAVKTPVPQNCEPRQAPHSPVENAGSSCRTCTMPTATS